MTEVQRIKEKFEEAGLRVEVLDRRPPGISGDIFWLGVGAKEIRGRRREIFQLYRGPGDVRVEVLDIEPDHGQLVLMVAEPERTFQVREWNARKRKHVFRLHKTTGVMTKYLVGLDERSYFMAPLSDRSATTVGDAHRTLKRPELRDLEARRSRPGRIVRQGEWFFIPASENEKSEIHDLVRRRHLRVDKKARVGRLALGKPHVADEVVYVPAPGDDGRIRELVFARGAVRHPDHRTVHLCDWHRVLSNTEDRKTSSRWID